MLSRRKVLACGLATLGVPWLPAAAHELVSAPQIVGIKAELPPGEIHVDPDAFALYWTLSDLTAIRFPCGVGKPGLYEPGIFYVGAKKEWPRWTPTPAMVERNPERYGPYAETGMPGGLDNPLGARALYLHTPERGDTFLRIHGTNAPETIGTAVSNGCARLLNEHMVELYEMVPLNTRVVLYNQGSSLTG
jgi:lipoprotein-anchoring transpeptidase ErfK/SrfK